MRRISQLACVGLARTYKVRALCYSPVVSRVPEHIQVIKSDHPRSHNQRHSRHARVSLFIFKTPSHSASGLQINDATLVFHNRIANCHKQCIETGYATIGFAVTFATSRKDDEKINKTFWLLIAFYFYVFFLSFSWGNREQQSCKKFDFLNWCKKLQKWAPFLSITTYVLFWHKTTNCWQLKLQ